MEIAQIAALGRRIQENVERVIVGKGEAVRLLLVALLARGHVLVEDVPGVGKTTLAKAMARSVGCTFRRIQFTPDLLPTDVTGVSVYNQKTGEFEFRPGPVMAQIVLADEINRATPKTQSALLEAMEEGQVTVDGVTHPLPQPFIVLATQNPIEYEGTYPLPEAQLDRFFLRIRLGYPTRFQTLEILKRQRRRHPIQDLEQVAAVEELLAAQEGIREVEVDPLVAEYLVALVEATREREEVYLGASPRAALFLYRGAQALAALDGRPYVVPEDVKALAVPVLAHRLLLTPTARVEGRTAEEVVREILEGLPVPGARAR